MHILIESDDNNLTVNYGTWNNRLSDMNDNTMIKRGAKVYNQMSKLKEGDKVYFSFKFLPESEKGVVEGSMIEKGG